MEDTTHRLNSMLNEQKLEYIKKNLSPDLNNYNDTIKGLGIMFAVSLLSFFLLIGILYILSSFFPETPPKDTLTSSGISLWIVISSVFGFRMLKAQYIYIKTYLQKKFQDSDKELSFFEVNNLLTSIEKWNLVWIKQDTHDLESLRKHVVFSFLLTIIVMVIGGVIPVVFSYLTL